MNHVKCIFNTSIPRRVSSNSATTQCSNCKNESSFKKRSTKPRSPSIDYSFALAVKKVYPLLRHFNSPLAEEKTGEMLCGTQGSKSKSIATSLRRLLSERKLPLQYVDGINSKQAVRFGSSSSLSYDRTINYDDDRDSRSYAQMITAYNETMMTVDNTSSILHDRSNSKLNVQLSKTLFRSTSTLTSSAYNFDNLTIQENREETSMTDLSYAFDTTIDNDYDFYEEKTKNLDIYNPTVIPNTNRRSYANIIADYSATMDVNSIMNNYKNDFPKMSSISFTSPKDTTLETPEVERNLLDFASTPDLNVDSCKRMSRKEELEWLRKVDKIINDLRITTEKVNTKMKQKTSSLKEHDVLKCVAEQAVWVDKSTLINKNKSNVAASREAASTKNQTEEAQSHEVRAEKTEKAAGIQATHNTSTSLNLETRKNWTQVPKNTDTNFSNDPQVELRMVPSGNESIVSVNVEAIAKAMESRNPDSKELSVIVSSNNKETLKNRSVKDNAKDKNANFGSMRISISEESLPVKEIELSINGKPISDVRSIRARTETLDVLTSMDKVEIRVPYMLNNPSKTNPTTKSFVKNVQSAESVLKLRIATAFDGSFPVLTTGVTKNVQPQSQIQPTSKVRYAHTEGSNVTAKIPEVPPTLKNQSIQDLSVKKTAKSDDTSSKKTIVYNVSQDRSKEPASATIQNKYSGVSNVLTSFGGGDVTKSQKFSDIDLRLTKTFGRTSQAKPTLNKVNTKATTEVKKNLAGIKTNPDVKKDNPAGIRTNPDIKKDNPAAIKTNPNVRKDNLAGIRTNPDVKKDNPAGIKTNPNVRKDNLAGIRTNPNVKKDNPAGIKTNPDVKKTDSTKTETKSTSGKDDTKSLEDIVSKHTNRSGDGNSSPASGKPNPGSNQNREGSKPSGNKRESKAVDEKKSTLSNESSKAEMFEQRIPSKWSPWWSSSDSYSKLKKEDEYQRSYSPPTNMTDKQKTREYDSTVQVSSKMTKEYFYTSEKEKTLSKKPEDLAKSKERKQETKESTSASSKARGAETTSKSPSKSENIRVTRQDSPSISESKRHTFSSQTKIVEEKLNKRNEDLSQKETKNASTLKEVESKGGVETKDDVKVSIKETSQIETKFKTVDAISKDKSVKDKEKTRNEKLIPQKASSTDGFPEKHMNMQQNVIKTNAASNVTKSTKSANKLSAEDSRLKDILNLMKPIEKKKDGTLIDYGVKVASRKKPEKLKVRPKSETTDVTKKIQITDQRLDSQTDIKTSYSVQQINVNMQNPKSVEIKEKDVTKQEGISVKDIEIVKGENPVNLSEPKKESSPMSSNLTKVNESLHERISRVLEKVRNHMSYQNVISESSNVENLSEVQKSNEEGKEMNSQAIKPEKIATSNKPSIEGVSNSLAESKDSIAYQNTKKESLKSSFKQEEPANAEKKTEHKTGEAIKEPVEGTETPKPSKLSPDNVSTDTGITEPLADTIVQHSLKDLEKTKSGTVPNKYSANTIQPPPNALEKPNNPSSPDKLKAKTNKKGDSPGSQNNSGTPSNPVNPSDSTPPKMNKSHSSTSFELENFNDLDKLRCTEKVKQMDIKSVEEPLKQKRPDKDLVYSAWLQRSKEKVEDKTS